jgi:hypothetical protein
MRLVTHLIVVLALLPLFGALRGDAQSLSFELRLTDGQIYTGAYPEGAPTQSPALRPGRIESVGGDFDSTYYKGCVSFGDGSRCNLMSSSQAGRAHHDVVQSSVDRVQSYDRQLDAHLAALDEQIRQLAAGQRPPEGSPAAQELARLGGIAEQARRELSSAKRAFAEARAADDSRSGEQASELTPIDLPELEYEPEYTYDDPALNADFKAYQAAASKLQAPRSVDPRPYLTPQDSEWGKKVDAADRYVRRAEGVVERMQADSYQRLVHRPTLAMARDSVVLGDQSLAAGALEDGQAYLEVAYQLADVAMGFVPGVGWGKDVYESVTGTNLLTGKSLSDTERAFAVLGVLTVGMGSKFANFGKMANLLRRFGKMDELVDAEKLAEVTLQAEKVFDSAKNIRSKLSNVGQAIPGTTIPKYFNIEAGGQAFHVNPNATKHMGEYINSLPASHGFPLRNDLMLASFDGGVKDAVTSGAWKTSLETGRLIISGGWELIFSQRQGDTLPVIIHALMNK